MFWRKKIIFFIFLTYVAVNCVLASEVDDVNLKNDKVDATSAEERDSIPSGALELEHEVINEQADQPSSGERFVAVHVHKMGAREELSPTLLGLTHLGITFLPAEYQFLTVISAAREVVAGVRFILLVNAERVETGERVVCTMEILEKPWITTEWGDKWRVLESTNCTGSPNPLAPDRNQYSQVNPIFTDRPKVVTEEKLREIEDQIITTTTPRDYYVIHNTSSNLPVELPEDMKALLDAYFQSSKPPPVRQYVPTVDRGVRPQVQEEANIEPKTSNPEIETPATTESYEVTTNTEIPQFSNQEEDLGQQQQILDPFFTIDPAQFPPNGNVQEIQREKRELGMTKTEETLFLLNRALEQMDAVDEDTVKRVAIEIYHLKETKDSSKCKIIEAQAHVVDSFCDENDENMRKCMENVHLETSKLCAIEVSLCDSKSPKLKKTACKPLPEKKSREKRSENDVPVLGGTHPVDAQSDEIKELVTNSLVSFNSKENDNYELHRIVSATKQVVEGWAYKIQVEFKSKDPAEVVQCDLNIWQRPWLKVDGTQTDISCDKHNKKYTFRAKRSIGGPVRVGGSTPVDVENEKIKELVSATLVSFNSKENDDFELHRVVSATKQVVAGMRYDIKLEFKTKSNQEVIQCDLSVWERSWLPTDSSITDISCDNEKKKYTFRARRSVDSVSTLPAFGSPSTADVNSDEIKNLVATSLVSINGQDNNNYKLHRIVSASKQVVQGWSYKIKVEFKEDEKSDDVVVCDLDIWERSWLKEDNLRTEVSCDNEKKKYTFRTRRSVDSEEHVKADRPLTVPGGPIPIDLEKDKKVPELVKNTLTSFNTKEDGNFELHRIVSATKKMVAGILYEIKVEFKSRKPESVVECSISVWERPWLTENGSETNISCDNDKKKHTFRSKRSLIKSALKPRSKRQLVGGPKPIENFETDAKVQELVKNSLVSFNTKEDNSFEFHRIISATSKVVAGALYEIKVEFKNKESQEVIQCDLSVWERPWLPKDNSETNISCDNAKKKYTFRARRSIGEGLTLKGGPKSVDVENNSKIQDYVKNSLVTFNEKENNDYELVRIVSGTKKTVAGTLYDIKLELKKKSTEEIISCSLEVWERLRPNEENPKIDITCPDADKKYTLRSKRSLIYDHRRRTTDDEQEEAVLQHQRTTLARHEELFHKFQMKYDRAYHSSMEKSLRFRIFQDNLARIQQLNERERGTAKYGITEFADLTPTEYRMRTGLWNRENEDVNHISNPMGEIPNFKLPKSFDWRDKGVISQVKNQGNCGSCWAFSVIGNIEGLHAIKTGVLEEYSEQELVDCDTIDGACAGGLPDNAYKAIEQIGGLELESDYPYKAKQSQCSFNKTKVHVKVTGAVDLPKNETAMALWLVQNGPLSIGINANAMQFYRGGISHPWRPLCRHSGIDHGVLIVGFGVSEYPLFNKTLPYWIVKNSWGPKWGEQGYYRVFRGDNTCGISEMVSSAVIAD